MKKAIVVVFGKDRAGIIYNVCKILYENNVNILNISQSIVDGNFNMMMVADISKAKNNNKIVNELSILSEKIKVKITFQLEETFTYMHRV